MSSYKRKAFKKEMPKDFPDDVVKTIERIQNSHNVIGVLFLRAGIMDLYTVPEITAQRLVAKLPPFNEAVHRAITEIDLPVMKIITNLLKDRKDEWLVHTTALINSVNPMVDRIMDDDSVEGVVMTNKEGAPILTNVSVTSATSYGKPLCRLALLMQTSIKELDIFDEVKIVRLTTKKNEIMLAPHNEFNVIVVQHARRKIKDIEQKKKTNKIKDTR